MAGIETLKRAEFNLKEHAVITDYYKVYKEYRNSPQAMADDIAGLYRRTYAVVGDTLHQRSYPYPESFDPDWIHSTATNPRRTVKKVKGPCLFSLLGN